MTDLVTIVDQLRLLVAENAPRPVLNQVGWTGLAFLTAGIGFSVLGAKLARFGLTVGMIAVGGVLGATFGRHFDFAMPLCVMGGAAMIGTLGYLTFRFWVGLAASAVVAAIALGAFGYHQVLPHLSEFQSPAPLVVTDGADEVALVSTAATLTPVDGESHRQWVADFWTHVRAQAPMVERNAHALGVVALVTGLLFGLVAMRTTLIASTSLIGTLFLATGLGMLLELFSPTSYQSALTHPGAIGIGFGSFLATSLVLQTLLTRQPPAEPKAAARHS